MMGVFFIGDTHFGHNGVHNFREQFSDDNHHNETIFNNIMSVSGKRNDIYLMGDICFNIEHFHYVEEISKNFNNVKLIIGNHDFERTSAPKIEDYLRLNISIHGFVKYKEFWLSHAPIHPEELRDRINIHGHVHYKNIDDARYLNVSCENIGFKPISLENIRLKVNL